MSYARLLVGLFVLGAIAAAYGVGYTKGQASVFKGIVAGTATFQKEQSKIDDKLAQQAVEDALKIQTLEQKRNALLEQLAYERSRPKTVAPSCPSSVPLRDDALERVSKAASEANKDGN